MRTLLFCLLALLTCLPAAAQNVDTKRLNDHIHLLGVWTSNCYNPAQITRHGQNIFVKDTYSFGASGSYTLESSHFTDAQCSQPQGNPENFFGEYALGEPVETADAKNLRRINLTLDNADWPAELPAENMQWVLNFTKNRLFFGFYNPPNHSLMPGLWFEKLLTPNNGIFVF